VSPENRRLWIEMRNKANKEQGKDAGKQYEISNTEARKVNAVTTNDQDEI